MPRLGHSLLGAAYLALLVGCGDGSGQLAAFPEPVVLEFERGATSREIAETLEAHGVIRSKWAFLWQRALHRKTVLMAGEYVFERPVTAARAFKMLASGRVRLYRFTVPEGYNRFEVAELVAAANLASRQAFLQLTADPAPVKRVLPEAETLEGCLFPDTYSLAKSSTAEDLVAAMVARFFNAMRAARRDRTSPLEAWDALILASMIEKETGREGERGLVSAVFHNRMRRGMLLQCDPTVIYGLVAENRYRGRILRSDLQDDHPYNTYIHQGLPPGPIANPGQESLQAAFAPAESDYLYFVAKPGSESGHAFSKSLRDHNRAVRTLRRFQRSR